MTPDAPATAFDVVTAVWGAEFINLYLDLCIANQSSAGNLPALPPGSRYRIFTASADVAVLATEPRLDAVRRILPVDIVEVDLIAADREARPREQWNTHKRMIACHRKAAADAAVEKRGLIFLAPDFVLGEGTIAGLLRLHAAGARAVMTMNLRTEREAVLAEVAARGGSPALPPRELVAVGMRNLHPWTRSLMADSQRTSDNPMSVYWPVRSGAALEGLLIRTFFLHPMLVDPVDRTKLPGGPIDSHYVRDCCPDLAQVHVVDDSDELVVFELSPVGREIGRGLERDGVSALRLAAVSARCDGHQFSYWPHRIRLHAGPFDERWTAVERASSAFARRVDRWRRFGPALVVVFESLLRWRRRREQYETAALKARKRSARALQAARERGAESAAAIRKSLRPPITAKQAARPVKLLSHRAAKAWSTGLKRLRRRTPLVGR